MQIEQAIYTHVKVRRDTHTMGFGYYSMTSGMKHLLAESRELKALSCGYIAPRNTECWWETEEHDPAKRDEIEADRIAAHHPLSFGYSLFKTGTCPQAGTNPQVGANPQVGGGKTLAAMTYGKNLGRDLSPLTRDGNILVNTIVLPPESLNGYPYEYYGSREVFYDIDRSFFANADDEPAPDLHNPLSLSFGRNAPTHDDVAAFIEQGEGRTEQLLAMLGALMDIADGGKVKRLLVCDNKDNMINWIAALSLIYPVEIAAGFTFRTYSFLGGTPDDPAPVYDDVMFCGVYTPTVNGDTFTGKATNYDFATEWVNNTSAIVDIEQNSCYSYKNNQPYFMMFVEGAFTTDIRMLEKYQDFIMLETSCRTLGHDYAKGYSFYAISRLKNMQSLKYLSDAVEFAEKYMSEKALKELLSIAFTRMNECGCGGDEVFFGQLADITRKCVRRGVIERSAAAEAYMSRLMKCYAGDEIMHDEYLEKKAVASEFLKAAGSSFDAAFVGTIKPEGIMKMVTAPCKRWKLKEAAKCVGGVMATNYTDELANVFMALGIRLISSEKKDRSGLIASLIGKFDDSPSKIVFLEEMYCIFNDEADICGDLAGCMAELYMKDSDETFGGILQGGELYDMLNGCLSSASGARGLLMIYAVFRLSKDNGGLSEERLTAMIDAYFGIASELYGCYGFDSTTGIRLLEMIAASEDPLEVMNGGLGNAAAVFYIDYYAEEPDIGNMLFEPEQLKYLNFENASAEDVETCAEIVGKAFARRSIILGSAVNVRFAVFVDCEDPGNTKFAAKFFMVWMREIAASEDRKSAHLFGQVLAMAAADHRVDCAAIGNILAESEITPGEIEGVLESSTVTKYLHDTGSLDNALHAYFTGLMIKIGDIYDAAHPKKRLGKFKDKFGNKKKMK